jgi:hypothetical protein
MRKGSTSTEYAVMLVLVVLACLAAIQALGKRAEPPPPVSENWPVVVGAVLGLVCVGLPALAGLAVVAQAVGRAADRRRRKRTERKFAALRPLLYTAAGAVPPADLASALRLLHDPDEQIHRLAFRAARRLLCAAPELTGAVLGRRGEVEQFILGQPGFARAVHAAGADVPLPALVTLGAKVGAGTHGKCIAPATSDPAALAQWITAHKGGAGPCDVQVSIGYDTGWHPSQADRGRFLALFLFIACTDLKQFRALTRKPPRDPGAAYGLLIRGDRLEVKYPGQSAGRRLDYVFPLPARMSEASLAEFLTQIQLLNLGLLLAAAEDGYGPLLPAGPPEWFGPRARAAARVYRSFERRLVALLRRHDAFRDPDCIYPLEPADHAERQAAFRNYRLEECLYPGYPWVVPLYQLDTGWDRLLAPLRAVEGMLLHQGAVPGRTVTRGLDFIQRVRVLGYRAATAIARALDGPMRPPRRPVRADPFIDPAREAETVHYLRHMSKMILLDTAIIEELPDPRTFHSAAAYYGAKWAGHST